MSQAMICKSCGYVMQSTGFSKCPNCGIEIGKKKEEKVSWGAHCCRCIGMHICFDPKHQDKYKCCTMARNNRCIHEIKLGEGLVVCQNFDAHFNNREDDVEQLIAKE